MSVIITPRVWAQGGNLGSNSSPVVNRQGIPLPGVNISACQPVATTAAIVTSNLGVLTLISNPITAGFAPGMTVQVAGFTGADSFLNAGSIVNGQITGGYTLLSVTPTTVTFAISHGNYTATGNGTVLQQGNSTTSCGGLAPVFSDPALTIPSTQPFNSDQLGNWNVFVAPGLYYVQFYSPTVQTTIKPIVVGTTGGGGGVGGNPAPPGFSLQFANQSAASFASVTGLTVDSLTNPTQLNIPINLNVLGSAIFGNGSPWFDVTSSAYKASGSIQTTTGSINATSTTLTIASALDFKNGQGIRIYHAGTPTTLTTPASCAVITQGVIGTTTYNYQVSALDAADGTNLGGGETASCAQVTTNTGNATLGGSVVASISSLVRTGTTLTFVLSQHLTNSAAGNVIVVSNGNGGGDFTANGVYQIAVWTDDEHFTVAPYADRAYYKDGTLNLNGTGTVTLYNGNVITWAAQAGVNRFAIWRGGTQTFLGMTSGGTNFYLDRGQAAPVKPDWTFGTASNPSVAQNDWLVTSIVSGFGTTSLTLANAAVASVSALPVHHDDTAAVNSALSASNVTSGFGPVIFPQGKYELGRIVVPQHTVPGGAGAWFKIVLDGATLNMYGSWLSSNFVQLEGWGAGAGASFSQKPASTIQNIVGGDVPLLDNIAVTAFAIDGISWTGSSYFADTLLFIGNSTGQGNTTINIKNSSITTPNANVLGVPIRLTIDPSRAATTLAGFGLNIDSSTLGASSAAPQTPMSQSIIFSVNFGFQDLTNSNFTTHGVQVVNIGGPLAGYFNFRNTLYESGITDMLMAGGGTQSYQLVDAKLADAINPISSLFTTGTNPYDITIQGTANTGLNPQSSAGVNGLYITTSTSTTVTDPPSNSPGGTSWTRFSYNGQSVAGGGGLLTLNALNSSLNAIYVKQGNISTPALVLNNAGNLTTITGPASGPFSVAFPASSGTVCLTTTCAANFYQTVDSNATVQTQRPILNFIQGTNMTVNCVDNAGATRTDCTFTSTNTAATAWSAITAATNSNAGTFAASGNTWDFSAATTFKMPSAGFTQPGSGSGLISFLTQAASGTFNWNWPTTAGASGSVLASSGGGANPMSWVSPTITVNGLPCTLAGSCAPFVAQVAGNPLTNANLLNLVASSTNSLGLTSTPTNTSGGIVKYEIGGLLNATGGGTGISAPQAHCVMITEGASPFNLNCSPVVNGYYGCGFNVFAGAGVDLTCTLQGVPIVVQAGGTPVLTSAADVTLQQFTSGSAQAVTGPPLANNITFALYITGAGGITYTPATGNVNGIATQVAPQGSFCFEYTDNSNTQMPCMPTFLSLPNSASHSALIFNSTTNVFSSLASIVTGPASSTSGDVPCFNGVTGLILQECGTNIVGANVITSASTQTSGAIAIGAGAKTLGAPLAATGADYLVIGSGAGVWSQIQINGNSSCGDATHALSFTAGTPGSIGCQTITVSAAAGGSNTQVQYNNAGALAGITQLTTNGTTTITLGATGVLDLSAGAPTSALKIPSAAGAVPTADGFVGFNTTAHVFVTGSNGTTMVQAIAGTGTTTSTTCTNQVVTVISALAAPTCSTLTNAYLPVVAVANGGTNNSTPAFVALTDGATVTWAIASALLDNASLTFTVHSGSRTLNITNPVNGGSYVLWIKQDGTGGEGLTLGTGCTWKVQNGGAGAITPSVAANAIDVLAFTYDGTNCYATFSKNYN